MEITVERKWFEEYLESEVSCPECGSVVEIHGDEKYVYCEICDTEVMTDATTSLSTCIVRRL